MRTKYAKDSLNDDMNECGREKVVTAQKKICT